MTSFLQFSSAIFPWLISDERLASDNSENNYLPCDREAEELKQCVTVGSATGKDSTAMFRVFHQIVIFSPGYAGYSPRQHERELGMIGYGPAHFINRELSWLEFNQRVLDEACDPQTPLLERLKFFCIVSSNLDEFFEVRVAGLKQQMETEAVERSFDGLSATETFRAITKRVRRMVDDQYARWRDDLRPALAKHGIRFLNIE